MVRCGFCRQWIAEYFPDSTGLPVSPASQSGDWNHWFDLNRATSPTASKPGRSPVEVRQDSSRERHGQNRFVQRPNAKVSPLAVGLIPPCLRRAECLVQRPTRCGRRVARCFAVCSLRASDARHYLPSAPPPSQASEPNQTLQRTSRKAEHFFFLDGLLVLSWIED